MYRTQDLKMSGQNPAGWFNKHAYVNAEINSKEK